MPMWADRVVRPYNTAEENKKRLCLVKRQRRLEKRPLRYHSRCRATRPLSPTIRGRGVITARFRPCLLFAFSRMLRGDIRAMPASALHRNGGSLRAEQQRCVSPSSRLCHVYHEISVNITIFSPFVNGIFTKNKEESGVFQMIPATVSRPMMPMPVYTMPMTVSSTVTSV